MVACAEVAGTEVACALIARPKVSRALIARTEIASAEEMRVAAFGVFSWFQVTNFDVFLCLLSHGICFFQLFWIIVSLDH